MTTRLVADAVRCFVARRFPHDEFVIVDHGRCAGLMVRWVDGPTPHAVRSALPRTADPVVLDRRWGPEGLGLAVRVADSLLPFTRLRTWTGGIAVNRGLVLEDAVMYRKVFRLPQTPETVGEVLRAVHDRIDLAHSPAVDASAPTPVAVFDWAAEGVWGAVPGQVALPQG